MPFRELTRPVLLFLVLIGTGCETSSAPPTTVDYIPCAVLQPFLYRDEDSEITRRWGDNFNAMFEELCLGGTIN